MTASVAERRIKKELQKLRNAREELGMTVEVGSSPIEWFVTIIGERQAMYSSFAFVRRTLAARLDFCTSTMVKGELLSRRVVFTCREMSTNRNSHAAAVGVAAADGRSTYCSTWYLVAF